jgi:hypothetical protein
MGKFFRLTAIVVSSLALLGLGSMCFIGQAAVTSDDANPAITIAVTSCNPTFKAGRTGATYVVAGALAAAAGKDCIDVTAPGVTIDLAGFTLTGAGGGNGVNIKKAGATVTTSVAGGGITGFSVGVLDTASSARIEGLGIYNNSVAGVEIIGSGTGASPFVDGTVVASNGINGNGTYGVYLRNTTHCMVDRNTQISSSSGYGVWIQNTVSPAPLADNVVSSNEMNLIGFARIEVGNTGKPAACSGGPASIGNIIANNDLPFDATGNSAYGIGLECNTGTNGFVFHNTVGPGAGTIDDLFDGNAACDANIWGLDVYGTHNQACAN